MSLRIRTYSFVGGEKKEKEYNFLADEMDKKGKRKEYWCKKKKKSESL